MCSMSYYLVLMCWEEGGTQIGWSGVPAVGLGSRTGL